MSNLNAHNTASFTEIQAAAAERCFASPDKRVLRNYDFEDDGTAKELTNIELQAEFFAVAVLPQSGPIMEFGDVPKIFS